MNLSVIEVAIDSNKLSNIKNQRYEVSFISLIWLLFSAYDVAKRRNQCRSFVYLLLMSYLVSLFILQFSVFADDGPAQLVQAAGQLIQPLLHTATADTSSVPSGNPKLPTALKISLVSIVVMPAR